MAVTTHLKALQALELAVREGFESVEHIKRYTLTGFGTDQGKTSNITALASCRAI